MSSTLVKRIADAVLYEGYILYPYRPSIKNRQRWTFGGLYPELFAQAQSGSDAASNQTECLVEGTADTVIHTTVRFLHLTARVVGEYDPPLRAWCEATPYRRVEALQVGARLYQTWHEAEECEVVLQGVAISGLLDCPEQRPFDRAGRRWLEPLHGPDGLVAGVLVRDQRAIAGIVTTSARRVGDGLFRVTVRVANVTPTPLLSRDEALLQTLASSHTVLQVERGQFISLVDSPEVCRVAAAECTNVGVWPVLVGEDGERATMLSSPIILCDYPRIAPESPGDFFDGSEIDEMLTLRILTLTDDEKHAMAMVDERARALLARTEAMDGSERQRLHGTVRELRPVSEGGA
jgi:hypothetical protein